VTPLRVVIAPDSFKGSAAAGDVAAAIAAGWRSVRPQDDVRTFPMADGGEGTLAAFEAAVPHAVRHPVRVDGPDDRPVAASWLELPDGTAVVELAATSGLPLLDVLRPLDAHTRGFGQAIAVALAAGCDRLVLALGGSASTDGGTGALTALGARFLDSGGRDIPPGGGGLARLTHLDLSVLPRVPARGVAVLCDVTAPLLGPTGAAAQFGPQKGAGAGEIALLEQGLTHLAAVVRRDPQQHGFGAAGGTAFGLALWGADLVAGAPEVGAILGLPAAVAAADVVISGEGRLDAQTAGGKAVSFVLGLPGASRRVVIAGDADTAPAGVDEIVTLVEVAGSVEAAMADPLDHLRTAAAQAARSIG
jgi:glycerate 2-kinase